MAARLAWIVAASLVLGCSDDEERDFCAEFGELELRPPLEEPH